MARKVISNYINKIRPIVDGILIATAFMISFLVRFSGNIPTVNFEPFKRFWPIIIVMGLASLWLVGLYDDRRRQKSELLWLIILSALLTILLTMGLLYLAGIHSFPRSVLILYLVLSTILLFAWRLVISSLHRTSKVLLIGEEAEIQTIVPKFESFNGAQSFRIVKVLTTNDLPLKPDQVNGIDIICISASVPNELREKIMLDALQWGIELYLIPRVYEIMLKGAEFSQLDDSLYFRIKPLAWDPVQRFIKRAFDIVLALTGFLLGWWLFPIIALAIRLDSPGPVIYSQVRAGRDNRLFKVHKFRTMIDGAERLTGPVMASANDPRITKVGSFLRKTRLDELPQLWNVLKGEMSFVGPRPERPNFIQEFARMNPSYNYRMKVKPGITGLAQVKGNYSTDFRDKLKFDLLYIRNYSIFLDLQIIANTLQVIFTPKKAEGTVVEQSLEYKKEVAATEQ